MQSFLYRYQFPGILDGNTRAALVRVGGANYNPNPVMDLWLADIPAAARAAFSPSLTGRSWIANRFSCDDYNFGVVPAGGPCQAIVIFEDSGGPAASPLIAFIGAGAGLPATPNGVGVIHVSVAAAGVFTLLA